jgi:uncharacterized membrane protein (UPF0127 family)
MSRAVLSMTLFRRGFLALVIVLAGFGLATAADRKLPTGPLEIVSGGKVQKFTVELATTPDDMARGLMYRRSMGAAEGMLFDYGQERPDIAFWMKNTYIPLDMLFIKANGTILNIHERAIPRNETPIYAAGPVRLVLELNGGTASRLGIKPGDRIRHAVLDGR